jgi:GDP-4-dehydro-6-deoxy-D-mannose reductase
MSILITGIAGMVGTHLTDHFIARKTPVFGIYESPTLPLSEINSNANFEKCDIRDAVRVHEIIDRIRPQKIFHLAAQSYPVVSWEKPAETLEVNIIGTVNVCEAVKSIRRNDPNYDPVIVVACSSAEYGASLTSDRIPITEDAPLLPLHPYGVSKVGQDLIAYQYHQSNQLRTIRVRIFNTTGPRKSGDVAGDFSRRVVDIERGLEKFLRVGNLETRRAIMDVRDLVQALAQLSEKGVAGEVYNVSGSNTHSMRDVVDILTRFARVPLEVRQDPALLRPVDEPVIIGDTQRLFNSTGWHQKIPLEQTLSDMLDYWRLQPTEAQL